MQTLEWFLCSISVLPHKVLCSCWSNKHKKLMNALQTRMGRNLHWLLSAASSVCLYQLIALHMCMTCQSQEPEKCKRLVLQQHAKGVGMHPIQCSERASPTHLNIWIHAYSVQSKAAGHVLSLNSTIHPRLTMTTTAQHTSCSWRGIDRHTTNMRLQRYLLLLPLLAGFSSKPLMLCTPPELLLSGGHLLQNALAPLIQQLQLESQSM